MYNINENKVNYKQTYVNIMEKSVNERIRKLRLEHLSLNQTEFCNKVDINVATLSRIENSETTPNIKTINSIMRAFSVNRDWMYNGKGEVFESANKAQSNANPWEDALVSELKEEVNYLREMLKMSMNKGNFRKVLNATAVDMYNKSTDLRTQLSGRA